MSDYNKYVTAVNKIFEVAAKLKVNYPDNDNIGLVESIEETKSAVVAGAKLFGNGPQQQTPSTPTEQPTQAAAEPPKEGA